MFRRLFWMVVGGWVALWGRSKVVRTVEKYIPTRIAKAAERTAKNFAKELALAGKESKAAMQAKESELRNS
jgi:hypothetical protein